MDYEYVESNLESIYSLVDQLQDADLEDSRMEQLVLLLQDVRQNLWILLEGHL